MNGKKREGNVSNSSFLTHFANLYYDRFCLRLFTERAMQAYFAFSRSVGNIQSKTFSIESVQLFITLPLRCFLSITAHF